MTHPTFNSYRSETEMLRYITKLRNKDLSLAHAMIPLGSCTMKLNATTEMIPVTWEGFGRVHPYAPLDQQAGMPSWRAPRGVAGRDHRLRGNVAAAERGSQGEYAGLLSIAAYHRANGDTERNICLIPTSAHGTNPASAVMAGMTVVPIATDDDGNIDVAISRPRRRTRRTPRRADGHLPLDPRRVRGIDRAGLCDRARVTAVRCISTERT